MFKRILIIFLISLGGVAVTVGGVLGIKYLKGDFKEEIISPENISFEQSEYYFDGNNSTYQIKITTTTENVNQDNVSLIFEASGSETWDSEHLTDGNLIIPKTVKLNQPFNVEVVKDRSNLENTNWTAGGVSKIIAKSENKLINPSEATVYVDVPVNKTDVLVYRETTNESDSTSNETLSLGVGEKIYAEVKFYPEKSASKYSKYSSSRMLTEYGQRAQNMCEARGIVVSDLFNELNSAKTDREYATIYQKIMDTQGVREALSTLITEFEENLKYVNFVENNGNNQALFQNIERLPGSNIYVMEAPKTTGQSELYAYTFKTITKEQQMSSMLPNDNVLTTLEQAYINGEALRTSKTFVISDVTIDQIVVSGSISNLYTGNIHTIYANKSGVNTRLESYLGIKLQNKNLPDLDLQEQISSVGIRFEKREGNAWIDALMAGDLELYGTYAEFIAKDNTYYKPSGAEPNWSVRVKNISQADYRAVVAYFAGENSIVLDHSNCPRFHLYETSEATENNLSWVDLQPVNLNVVNISGVKNNNNPIQYNPSFDLRERIDVGAIRNNVYQTVRYFIYSDNGENLNDFFDVIGSGANYTFADGSQKRLYELNSSILQFKDITNVFEGTIYAVYATVKTNDQGQIILDNGNYQFVKVSSVYQNNIERLSGLAIDITKSLSSLSGTFMIAKKSESDPELAGVVDVDESKKELHVAQDASKVLELTILPASNEGEQLKSAYESGQISILAKVNDSAIENYVSVNSYEVKNDGKIVLKLNTARVESDKNVTISIAYTFDGTTYLFDVNYDKNTQLVPANQFKIIYDTSTIALFDFGNLGSEEEPHYISENDIINVSTTYEKDTKKFTQTYKLNGNDANLAEKIFGNDGKLNVAGKNFLYSPIPTTDEWYTSGWYLESSNTAVANINDDGQTINFVGSGDVTISLYTKDSSKIQQVLNFNVAETGYVSKIYYGSAYKTCNKGEYMATTVAVEVEGKSGDEIYLTGENPIFKMEYTLTGYDENPIKLNLEPEINVSEDFKIKFNGALAFENGNKITISQNFGTAVAIDVTYKQEDLNITQKLTINIKPVISVRSFTVTNTNVNPNEEIVPTQSTTQNMPVYEVYSAVNYKIESILNGASDASYYLQDVDNKTLIGDSTTPAKITAGELWFDDVREQTDYIIHISSNNNGISSWDLDYPVIFRVKPNIKVKDSVQLNGVETYMETPGEISIPVSNLVERIEGSATISNIIGNFTLYSDGDKTKNGINLESLEFNDTNLTLKNGEYLTGIINQGIITASLTYAGYSVGTFDIKVNPHNYERVKTASETQLGVAEKPSETKISVTDNRIFTWNGQRAFVFVVGDNSPLLKTEEIRYYEYDLDNNITEQSIILSQFYLNIDLSQNINNQEHFSITNWASFKQYVTNSSNKITGIPSVMLYLVPNSNIEIIDEYGNKLIYRIIISQLPITALNLEEMVFESSDGTITYNSSATYANKDNNDAFLANYKKLDLYTLFMQSGSELLEAYKNSNLQLASGKYYGGQKIDLKTLYNSSLFIDDAVGTISSFDLILPNNPNELASKYASVSIDETSYWLNINQIGDPDGLFIQVNLRYKVSNYIYTIPCIIKINQSERLDVFYEYEDLGTNTVNNVNAEYGTDSYDNGMLAVTKEFENIPMEYGSFNINGNATFDLNQGQLIVNKFKEIDEAKKEVWEADTNYDGYYEIVVDKLATNVAGKWEFENSSSFNTYVTIDEANLIITVRRNGCTGVRVKLKITIASGSANYYYIQVGDIPSVILNKSTKDGMDLTVTYDESITLSEGDILILGKATFTGEDASVIQLGENQTCYAYYLKYYEISNLKAKLKNGEFEEYFKADESYKSGKKYTVNLLPNGKNLDLVLYSKYGELATIHIEITPYFTANLKKVGGDGADQDNDITLYSGTENNISNLVEIKYGESKAARFTVNFEKTQELLSDMFYADTNYLINDDYAITSDGEIIFNHSNRAYTIPKFAVVVKITVTDHEYDFIIELNNLTIQPSITAKTGTPASREVVVNDGKITLTSAKFESADTNTIWQELFSTQSVTPATLLDLKYYFTYGNEEGEINSSTTDITINVGTITAVTQITVTFTVVGTNPDGSEVMIPKQRLITLIPEYTVTVNYPQPNVNTNFGKEFIMAGATIDLAGDNFAGVKRVVVTDNKTGNAYDSMSPNLSDANTNGTKITFGETWSGDASISIMIDGIKYGEYKVYVQAQNPFAVDISRINEKTVYVGYGDDEPLEYVDITLRLDAEEMSEILDGDKFSIISKYYDNNDEEQTVELLKDIYYRGEEASCEYKIAVSMENYDSNINTQNIYAIYEIEKDGGEKETKYVQCRSVTISRRYDVSYNGANVNFEYLNNILNFSYSKVEGKDFYEFEITYNSDSVASDEKTTGTYQKAYDIDVKLTPASSEYDILMYANQFGEHGISMASLFNIVDSTGKKLWYNHVGSIFGHGQGVTVNLSIISSHDNSPIRLEQQLYNGLRYDYNIIALGAKNDGTIVTLEFVYSAGEGYDDVKCEKEIKIKVMPDISYSLLNNDESETPNSSSNPLVIDTSKTITLVRSSQTTTYNTNYYVYAYSQFDTSTRNVAQTFRTSVSGNGTSYASFDKDNKNNLVLTVNELPEFGDKSYIITFTDDFGYTFTYYILLKADNTITSVRLTNEQVFEGDKINAGNRKYDINSTIQVSFEDPGTKDNKTQAYIQKINYVGSNEKIYVSASGDNAGKLVWNDGTNENVILSISGTSGLNFDYAPQAFWNMAGLSYEIDITLDISNLPSGDYYTTQTLAFNYTKHYGVSLDPENTYVRDGVPFYMENLITVRDYKGGYVLGEPVLKTLDAIAVQFEVEFSKPYSFVYSYKDSEGKSKTETISNQTIQDLIDTAQANELYKDILSECFGIIYNVDNNGNDDISVSMVVKAKNKYTNNVISYINNFVLNSNYEVDLDKENNYVTVGDSPITPDAFKSITDIDIYEFSLSHSGTVVGDDVEAGDTNNSFVTKVGETDFCTKTNLTTLQVGTASDISIKLAIGGQENYESYSVGITGTTTNNVYKLTKYIGSDVTLFTGKVDGEEYFNGLRINDVLKAKNIYVEKATQKQIDLKVQNALFRTDLNYGVDYQESDVSYSLKLARKDYTYTNQEIRVTLRYTGIDTSNAYVGTYSLHRVNLEDLESTKNSTHDNYLNENDEVSLENGIGIGVNLNEWSKGFKLVPGVGKSRELAINSNENLTFNNNSSSLTFKLNSISGTSAQASDLVALDESSGKITLKNGFKVGEYYISIGIYCKYPTSSNTSTDSDDSTTSSTGTDPLPIGSVLIAFYYNAEKKYSEVAKDESNNSTLQSTYSYEYTIEEDNYNSNNNQLSENVIIEDITSLIYSKLTDSVKLNKYDGTTVSLLNEVEGGDTYSLADVIGTEFKFELNSTESLVELTNDDNGIYSLTLKPSLNLGVDGLDIEFNCTIYSGYVSKDINGEYVYINKNATLINGGTFTFTLTVKPPQSTSGE